MPRPGRAAVVFILLAGFLITFLSCRLIQRTEENQTRTRFERLVENRLNLFNRATINHEELLISMQNMFLLKPDMSAEEFRSWAGLALKRQHTIKALEWVPRVREADREKLIQRVRAAGYPNFEFTRRLTNGVMEPAPAAEEHFPILYVEPMKGNEAAHGYDLAFGPSYPVLTLTRDIADAALTGRIRLVQEKEEQYGMIAIAPVYRGEIAPKTVAERREKLMGYVQIVFRLSDMFETIITGAPPGGADILIMDDSAKGADRLLHFHASRMRTKPIKVPTPEEMAGPLYRTRSMRIGERNFSFHFRPAPEWLAVQSSQLAPTVAGLGTCITLLLAFLFYSAARRTEQVQSEVEEKTAALLSANESLALENKERQQAVNALRESEARFRSLVELAPVGVWQLEPDGQIIRYINPMLHRMLGLKPGERVEGRNIRDFVLPESLPESSRHLAQRILGIASSYEIEYLRADGGRLPVLIYGAPLRDEAGQLTGIIGLSIDIADRRRAEQAFQQERQLLRTLIDTLPDPIFVKDRQGRFLVINQATRKFLGFATNDEALGKTVFDLFLPEAAELFHQDDLTVISTNQAVINREEPYLLPSGANGWFLTSKVPLRDATGEVIGLVGISRDITQEKAAVAERQKFEHKLQETQKLESLGVLAGGIAHDFNNLLTGILGNANLAKLEFPGNPILFEHLDQIEKSSQRAAELCRQMLAYAGKGRFVVQNLDVTMLVEEITHLLQLSISKKAVMRFQLTHGLPPVSADATQIRQILMNLVINASDAIGDRSGVINIVSGIVRADESYLRGTYLSPDLPAGDYVYIEVSDTGCGMSKETLARIFDPFFTTKFTGRGLGLAAVLGIVRAHKGALKVYSEEGRGSTFKLLLPCAQGPAAALELENKPAMGWTGQGTVLVVDDEETVRAVAARLLESLGFKTVLAQDGRDAVEKFTARQAEIHLVLMDLTMPHMDGEQAFRELRRINPSIRVLLMSGFNEQDAINRFTGKGLAGFIQKPFKRQELQEKLKNIMSA
jgi:PAS domain S-box-containing protein